MRELYKLEKIKRYTGPNIHGWTLRTKLRAKVCTRVSLNMQASTQTKAKTPTCFPNVTTKGLRRQRIQHIKTWQNTSAKTSPMIQIRIWSVVRAGQILSSVATAVFSTDTSVLYTHVLRCHAGKADSHCPASLHALLAALSIIISGFLIHRLDWKQSMSIL